ncbi:MAG TPA: hypothetical protein VNP72_00660 [Longimicrobium sp.]|nr:hypothetical protein [Longimicrobium sp.]
MLRSLFAAVALLIVCAPAARAQTRSLTLSASATVVNPVRTEPAAPAVSAEVRGGQVWVEARSAQPATSRLLVDVTVTSAGAVTGQRVRGAPERGRATIALPAASAAARGEDPVEVRVVIAVNG